MNSLVEENYLKALFNISQESGEVNVNELSKRLGIKMPSVTSMMKKLATKKLVYYESYKPLRLTAAGEREAGIIIRKHRLTEMFLVQVMGFGWEEVHEIAEQVEHIQSPVFFENMNAMLGFPTIDPHGSPIPDEKGEMMQMDYQKLSDCKPGDRVTVTAVVNTSSEFLTFLNNHHIKLGTRLQVLSVEPFDASVTVSYDQKPSQTLSHTVCERLLVEMP